MDEACLIRAEIVGKFLRDSRRATRLTQGQVAKILGYSGPQFVSNWERGVALPPLDVIPKLCKLYAISPPRFIAMFDKYQDQIMALERRRIVERLSI